MIEPTDGPESTEEALAAEISALRAQLADAETRAAAAKDAQLRAIAETENTRRRLERDLASGLKYASEKVLGDLVSVADSLELGLQAANAPEAQLQALIDGKEATYKQLLSVMERHGMRLIDPRGEPFNPSAHQAVQMQETTEVPPNHVVNVMQKGYKLHDRVLRPAAVAVAKAPPGS